MRCWKPLALIEFFFNLNNFQISPTSIELSAIDEHFITLGWYPIYTLCEGVIRDKRMESMERRPLIKHKSKNNCSNFSLKSGLKISSKEFHVEPADLQMLML